ncbi:tripartite tricarboxylate transporter TctB family protein [Roseateles sp. BYS180W]|uniref:Tripartite tricarboxylate transporter TctB family protein n=1 Tax=Roseateles rivi TaxID=3299028 RepID=A0ABW7FXS4_9BURK
MRHTRHQDFWAGLVLLAIGLGFAVGASTYPVGSVVAPGPGFFPLLVGSLLSAVGVFMALLAPRQGRARPACEGVSARATLRVLFCVLGSIAVFTLGLPSLGLVLTTSAAVLLACCAVKVISWRASVLLALALTLMSSLLFVWGLGLDWPLLPAAWLR